MDNPVGQIQEVAQEAPNWWADHIGALFVLFVASIAASSYFGEMAFGGLSLYGPYSPPPMPIDAVMATGFGITFAMSVFAFGAVFRGLGGELGIPEIPWAVQWPASLFMFVTQSTIGYCYAATGTYFNYDTLTIILLGLFFYGPISFVGLMNCRGVGSYIAFMLAMRVALPPSNAGVWWVWYSTVIWGGFPPMGCGCVFTLYLKDFRIYWALTAAASWVVAAGGSIARYQIDGGSMLYVTKEVVAVIMFTIFVLYFTLLYSRFKRNLPKALRKIKNVRLGYLRKMAQKGQRIARCQDMPAEAFGDNEKAQVFIITSHRWLDRYTCDVPTDEFPDGLRLGSMVLRLNEHYPASMSCCGLWSFCSWLYLSFRSQLYGGHDILIFFDFMGLPQIGKTSDGELIQRTEEETAMFMEALPSMGALYTIFPVFVLLEVTPGVHEYWASGWCSSEFVSSLLTKKLDQFSPSAVETYVQKLKNQSQDEEGPTHDHDSTMTLLQLAGDFKLDAKSAESVLGVFDADLNTKKFFAESDREIVRGIMHSYVLIRQLQDAILGNNAPEFQSLLKKVHAKGLEKNLSHATDENLNTLLHIAVTAGSVEIVKMLLSDPNIDPNERNLRGDTASQFFMFPRRGEAADMCRKATAHPAEYQPLPDLAGPLSGG